MTSFQSLGLGEGVLRTLADIGFEHPTPVQEQAIPVLLTGKRDFIGLAQTGTGKTAAFGLPLLELLDFTSNQTQALILAPTRELCVQIENDITKLSRNVPGLRSVAVYGGAPIQNQIEKIKRGAQIVVATPGRLLDLIGRKGIKLQTVNFVVLDEADEMLNMGFKEDIDEILSNTPKEKQTWLFSATMPREVRDIAKNYMTDPFELTVGGKNAQAENIDHQYCVVHARDRYSALKRMVDADPDIFAIVFCRTRLETQDIAEKLMKDGYNADALHGDLSQQQRDKVMKRYRGRSIQLLVATDVAARGIDVNDVTHVIHYNLPDEIENYTHRSGRTARAGKSGISICIINMKETGKIKQLERIIDRKFTHIRVPDGVQVVESQLMSLIHKIHNVPVNEVAIEKYLPAIFTELADTSKEELIKRVVSIEFNRFLEYYRDAHDLNVDSTTREKGRSSEERAGGGDRMFINLGAVDGFDTGKMLRMLCEVSQKPKETFGRISIQGVYSFIDVEKAELEAVMAMFGNEFFNGRPVRVEISESKGGGRSRERSKDRSGGSGSYGESRGRSGGRSGGGERSGGSRPRSGGSSGPKKYGSDKPSYGDKKKYDKPSGSGESGRSSSRSSGGSDSAQRSDKKKKKW